MDKYPPTTTSTLPFPLPFPPSTPLPPTTQTFTAYKIFGSLPSPSSPLPSNIRPLIILHGGPGLSHDYLLCLSALNEKYGMPVIMYDQIGTGASSHLRETRGDEGFWCPELFIKELENLVRGLGLEEGGYDVLGHSWGGMLAAPFAARKPKGLRKLILSNSSASMDESVKAYLKYRDSMSPEIKEILYWTGPPTSTPEYEDALMAFYRKHMCALDPWPAEFTTSFEWSEKDDTVSMTMNGPSEFSAEGSMRDWTAVPIVGEIEAETLVINGEEEGASDEAVRPFVEGIRGARRVKMRRTRHMPMYEDPEEYFRIVEGFLCGQ